MDAPGSRDGSLPLSVIVPVHDEGESIGRTLESLEINVPRPFELLICYDRDEDGTLPVVRPLLAGHPHWRLVKNTVHRGPSGALRSGFAAARGERVLVVMADLCDDFSQIPRMVAMVPRQTDIACPSRYCAGGAHQAKRGLKSWASRTAGGLLRLLAGMDCHDPTNSFKLYHGPMLRSLRLVSTVSFSVTLEIVAKAHCLGYRLAEMPTVWRERQCGRTKFRTWPSIVSYLPWFLLALLGAPWVPLPRTWLRRWISCGAGSPSAAT